MSDPTAASSNSPNPTPPTGQPEDRRGCGRRGFRRHGLKVLFAALVIGLVGFGLGRASGGRWHGPGFGMHGQLDSDAVMRRAETGINRVLGSVDGTAEQKAKIADIAKAAIKDLQPMREAARGSRDKLATALKSETVDRTAIEQLRTEQMSLGEAASKRAAQALGDAAVVLTPAQRAKLLERWQSRSWRG